ncbi:hypothetical protein Bsp3421_000700 [Burkholderia sp. FERM BP-3421]|jgi:hypothetical protein|uniref:hypothetical protein n=1 Tax=Burkholderia sp. FERM BP-3421 TaxID=1494466 RepID=UPI0023614FDE|nr:hypothetical protein [Burkholderia sp. FERM BP-3421]WDD90822.1 hypothetical protein Bsp3421_000700 [Burkholderia sp. FERM BP-3421]
MNMPNSNSNRVEKASMLASADQMVVHLFRAAPLDRLEDVDTYVGAIESIVFELLARHVDSASRGAARSAYKAGIAAGLYGVNPPVDGDAGGKRMEDSHSGALLKTMARAGWKHGRAIWDEAVSRHADKKPPTSDDSSSSGNHGT